jgi:hypothetical protein
MNRNIRLGILLLLTASCGCFTYSAQIELAPSSEAPAELTNLEVARVIEIVSKIVSERGLAPDPRLPEIERSSREDAEWDERVLALYSVGREASTDDRVRVSVLVHKGTDRCSVLLRDLDSIDSTDFTDALERSLTEALSAAFPSRSIRVERETVGPSLGP